MDYVKLFLLVPRWFSLVIFTYLPFKTDRFVSVCVCFSMEQKLSNTTSSWIRITYVQSSFYKNFLWARLKYRKLKETFENKNCQNFLRNSLLFQDIQAKSQKIKKLVVEVFGNFFRIITCELGNFILHTHEFSISANFCIYLWNKSSVHTYYHLWCFLSSI